MLFYLDYPTVADLLKVTRKLNFKMFGYISNHRTVKRYSYINHKLDVFDWPISGGC